MGKRLEPIDRDGRPISDPGRLVGWFLPQTGGNHREAKRLAAAELRRQREIQHTTESTDGR